MNQRRSQFSFDMLRRPSYPWVASSTNTVSTPV